MQTGTELAVGGGQQEQTIPTYAADGSFVGYLAPQAYQMFMQQQARQGNGRGGGGTANLLGLGSDAALAAYQLFGIGQLDSDFSAAKNARRKRYTAQLALIASANNQSVDLGAKLKTYLTADDELSFYQNRVIDGQLKGFWANALAAGGRALGDLVGGQAQGGEGSVSTWIMAAGGAFLLATLFDNRSNNNGGRNNPAGYQE